ncbi:MULTISPECIES: VOC family protein [Ochrobactrum]|uniref:Drug:proton antiporter n=1 Tax=Ochrobactrum quorumnocens TaxID=271865 RepID=A0A5N1JW27_9HYPH|nr:MULTISPECIES: VOC family protein [Brucella/Ochrobactrum group]KAA9368322.1 drug:proton antiporter [[Ochrobactrum] quorumnocens]MBD7991774.1 drug:proton antiporter [Ochrobactrum gallinarum]
MRSPIVLFYVADIWTSARFYTRLFGRAADQISPSFALFLLPSGMRLGLWSQARVEPVPVTRAGGGELGFQVACADEVDRLHVEWRSKGVTIALAPMVLDFGRSFVALDPDGHRLRVYALGDYE